MTYITESPVASRRNEMGSRLTNNTNIHPVGGAGGGGPGSQLPGCLVSFQLSNIRYKEKGWTVIKPSTEDVMMDNQKRALIVLKSSLRSM
jgi:hypothetical protein